MKLRKRENRPSSRPSSWAQLEQLRSEMNRVLEDPMRVLAQGRSFFEGWEPALDVYENDESITVRAELPGMKKEDISVSLEGDTLTISGERKDEEETQAGQRFRSERFFGRFLRSVTLAHPVQPNRVQANYKDGVLTVTWGK